MACRNATRSLAGNERCLRVADYLIELNGFGQILQPLATDSLEPVAVSGPSHGLRAGQDLARARRRR